MIQISDKDETILRKTPELVGEDKHAAWPDKVINKFHPNLLLSDCYSLVI